MLFFPPFLLFNMSFFHTTNVVRFKKTAQRYNFFLIYARKNAQ